MTNTRVKSMKTIIPLTLSLLFLLAPSSSAAKWLKPYPQRQYSATWHFDFDIQDLKGVKERILTLFKDYGGELTIPLDNLASNKEGTYQQLSYRIPRQGAEKALAKLKKLGTMKLSTQKDDDDSADYKDASDKLKRLKAEMSAQKEALKRMPAVSEAVSELAEALRASVSAHEKSKDIVLLNMVLQEGVK